MFPVPIVTLVQSISISLHLLSHQEHNDNDAQRCPTAKTSSEQRFGLAMVPIVSDLGMNVQRSREQGAIPLAASITRLASRKKLYGPSNVRWSETAIVLRHLRVPSPAFPSILLASLVQFFTTLFFSWFLGTAGCHCRFWRARLGIFEPGRRDVHCGSPTRALSRVWTNGQQGATCYHIV